MLRLELLTPAPLASVRSECISVRHTVNPIRVVCERSCETTDSGFKSPSTQIDSLKLVVQRLIPNVSGTWPSAVRAGAGSKERRLLMSAVLCSVGYWGTPEEATTSLAQCEADAEPEETKQQHHLIQV